MNTVKRQMRLDESSADCGQGPSPHPQVIQAGRLVLTPWPRPLVDGVWRMLGPGVAVAVGVLGDVMMMRVVISSGFSRYLHLSG